MPAATNADEPASNPQPEPAMAMVESKGPTDHIFYTMRYATPYKSNDPDRQAGALAT